VDGAVWDWYNELVQGQVKRLSGSIVVKDPAGQEGVVEWQFDRAFPCKWMGPELNAAQNNVAVETLELCYHTLKRAS
jgi:phage tail-like protein